VEDEIILRLPPNLGARHKAYLWKTIQRNRDCLSIERVLVIRNNGLGIAVAGRVARRLYRSLEDFWTRLVERPLMPSDWQEYYSRALPVRAKIRGRMREKLLLEPGIPGELAKRRKTMADILGKP